MGNLCEEDDILSLDLSVICPVSRERSLATWLSDSALLISLLYRRWTLCVEMFRRQFTRTQWCIYRIQGGSREDDPDRRRQRRTTFGQRTNRLTMLLKIL